MTEQRIDHVGEARACEEAALSIMRTQSLGIRPDADAQMQIGLAQVHAKLALVEAQQKANEIAERAVEQHRVQNIIAIGESGTELGPQAVAYVRRVTGLVTS